MVIIHSLRRITFNAGIKPGTKSGRVLKQGGLIVAASSCAGIYGFVKWASCDSNVDLKGQNKDNGLASGPMQRLQDVYKEQIIHSSMFRFGRAAYTVSNIDTKFNFLNIITVLILNLCSLSNLNFLIICKQIKMCEK